MCRYVSDSALLRPHYVVSPFTKLTLWNFTFSLPLVGTSYCRLLFFMKCTYDWAVVPQMHHFSLWSLPVAAGAVWQMMGQTGQISKLCLLSVYVERPDTYRQRCEIKQGCKGREHEVKRGGKRVKTGWLSIWGVGGGIEGCGVPSSSPQLINFLI